MFAITLHRPWTVLVARGLKNLENRSWYPPPDMLRPGDWLAIHAGKQFDDRCIPFALERGVPIDVFDAAACAAEGVVAVAQFGGVDRAPASKWWMGPPQLGWHLTSVVAIDPPVPCRGYQKLWRLRDAELAAVRAGYAKARQAAPAAR